MTANVHHLDHPKRTRSSVPGRNRPRAIANARAIGSENAHPGPAVWVPLAILFALSAAAYFLFLAKATGAWPFGY
jgi:hypothetical protein